MKIFKVLLVLFSLSFCHLSFANNPLPANTDTSAKAQVVETVQKQESSHQENSIAPLLFIAVTIIVGAATRHFLKKTPLPYTVLLLIFGILFGVIARIWSFSGIGGEFAAAVKWAGHIDPHLILFVFLPALIFEAAFNIDIHTFKKNFS